MAVRFKHGGVSYSFDTPEEALKMMALLKKQEADAAEERAAARYANREGGLVTQAKSFVLEEYGTPWTPNVFVQFIERLGTAQKKVLALLVERQRVTDEELRKELAVSGNQALAGILSGISKQAAALNIPARAIFSFENFRSAGLRHSTYAVAERFSEIARDMSWPNAAE